MKNGKNLIYGEKCTICGKTKEELDKLNKKVRRVDRGVYVCEGCEMAITRGKKNDISEND